MDDPTRIPEPGEAALRLAAENLVSELFSRIDASDLEGAASLYADDATFLGATGRDEILAVMRKGVSPLRSRHLIVNVRSSLLDGSSVLVEYTAAACTLEGDGPFAARTVFDQEQLIRRTAAGRLEIAEQRISGFTPKD